MVNMPEELDRDKSVLLQNEHGGLKTLAIIERDVIEKVLDMMRGNRTATADVLGIGRSTLYRKLREYGLA